MLAVACSGFNRSAAVDSFAAAHPEATDAQAQCVVDQLIQDYTIEGLETELEALATEPTNEAFELAQFTAMFGCGMTDDVEAALQQDLLTRDLGQDDAECVASALVAVLDDADLEVLRTSEMTDAFYRKYFDATEGCGALP